MTWGRPPPRVKQYLGSSPGVPALPFPRAVAAQRPIQPITKDSRHESEAWRRAVASLPCVLCGKQGDTQCAHRNEGKGMGLKTDDALTAALCTTCHGEIDQGSQHTRAQRRERMDKAILLTLRELARAGKVRAV